MTGYIHSIQSMSTLDGPGMRSVVFMSGCALRCSYCHNPDTWNIKNGTEYTPDELVKKLLRFKPYIKNGGVTFSGGEPCLQAAFVTECIDLLQNAGYTVALDTAGALLTADVEALLDKIDIALLDVKFTSEDDYVRYAKGSLQVVMNFMKALNDRKIKTWIRHVIVPGINDTQNDIQRLKSLLEPYSCIEKIELLPFRKLCVKKYKELGVPFPLEDTDELSETRLNELKNLL